MRFGFRKRRKRADISAEVRSEDRGLEIRNPKKILKLTPTRWHPQYGIHVGWSALILILAIGALTAVAIVSQLNLLFWAASLACAVFLISMLLPARMIKPLRIEKVLPDNGVAREPMPIRFDIHNKRRTLAVYSVRVTEIPGLLQAMTPPKVYIPYIGAGRSCSFQIVLTPTRRGQLELRGTRKASRFPFGLLTRFATEPDGRKITIYPALGKLDHRFLPGRRQLDMHLGTTQSQFRGSSDEFYALREYRRGDNPKHIHWKRSARMRQLLIREMCHYAPHRLTVILDTYLPSLDAEHLQLFEQAVSFAATVLCGALEAGYRASLVCATDPPVFVPPLAGRDAQHRLLRTLSHVEGQDRMKLEQMIKNWRWSPRWQGRGLVVTMDEKVVGLTRHLSATIGQVQVIVVGSSEWHGIFVPPSYLRSERKKS